ncbi:hypothetical protein BGX28_009789 [Mortierella sp. GBA30]|nr:hypothetical protein BGX28_009789 [Mortierella sp. GBA30]
MQGQLRLSLKHTYLLVMVACIAIWVLFVGSGCPDDVASSPRSRIAKFNPYEMMLKPFMYDVPKLPKYEVEHNVTLNENCTRHKSKKHLIYMLITEKTDTLYHENMRISDEIVFVSEDAEHCPKTLCCMVVKTGYDYWSLDKKVELMLKIVSNLFDGFVTLTKIDDDTYLDYGFFKSLQRNFTENTFFGKFELGVCSESWVDYVEGPFYTVSRRLIHCLLSDFRLCGSGYEDRAVTISIYRNCKDYERQDLRNHMNTNIFHKTYARKNKVLYLANDNPDTASLMYVYNAQGPALGTPVLSGGDAISEQDTTLSGQ